MCVAINCSFTLYFACYCIAIEGIQLLYVLGVFEALVFCGLGWILTCTSVDTTHLHIYCHIFNVQTFYHYFSLTGPTRMYEFDYQRDVQL